MMDIELLTNEDRMVPFIRTMNGMEVDIVEVLYLKENSNGATITNPDDAICRLCLKRDRCVDLNALNENFAEDIIAKCIPEVNMKSTRDPKICLSCQTSLINYYQFVSKCSVKQENIMECDDQEACLAIKSEELDIKTEEEQCDGNPHNSLSLTLSNGIPSEDPKIKSFVDKPYNQETDQKSISSNPNQNGDEIKMEYSNGDKLIEDVAVTRYHCYHCPYVTKQKGDFSEHIMIHQTSHRIKDYDCSFCSFKTKLKRSLTRHMLTHRDASDITTYQCTLCLFKTKWKSNLTTHMLIHKDASEVTFFDCSLCSYKTKLKSGLIRHMLIHKDASEVMTYQCALCPYKAKQKRYLTTHMLSHKDVSNFCPYKTKQKSYLTTHMLIHKDASEVMTYQCAHCPYKTKHKEI
ncbi:hypothetical protein NQ318_005963 [Aromia moschata]|uniref:C2H2-type domain-containing protein n=1 Tax=Aromia moschata TaxID=1265417 RepID=A0AAV8XEP8_9CUCU|nr:hypothetical protein NQ318_005963 [Aromia moschata]